MSDIVERLNAYAAEDLPGAWRRFEEARDEILRLRAENERLIAAVGEHVTVRSEYLARAEKAEAENERLRGERQQVIQILFDHFAPDQGEQFDPRAVAAIKAIRALTPPDRTQTDAAPSPADPASSP